MFDKSVKGWWFDGYGPYMRAIYTGIIKDNKLIFISENDMFSERRKIYFEGEDLIHDVTMSTGQGDGYESIPLFQCGILTV